LSLGRDDIAQHRSKVAIVRTDFHLKSPQVTTIGDRMTQSTNHFKAHPWRFGSNRDHGVTSGRRNVLAVPSRAAQRLPHLSAHDVAEIDREVLTALPFGEISDGRQSSGGPYSL
jgi:hypothetical protein